jgi:hypothetical protein
MKTIFYQFLLGFALLMSGCDDRFTRLQEDPNSPGTAAPIHILHHIIKNSWESPWTYAQRLNQYYVSTYVVYDDQGYLLGEYGMDYGSLRNILAMEKEVERVGTEEAEQFLPIAKFFKAFFYVRMTERLGDIPMSEAMKGEEGNFTPEYDTQKEVYTQCLKLLEEANDELTAYPDKSSALTNDLYYNGDLTKWRKAINTFHVRVLLSLSKRNDEMNVAGRLQAIVSNPDKYPLMESIADNMQITYYGTADDQYPLYPNGSAYSFIGKTYVDQLRRTEDPRIFIQMVPGEAQNQGVEGRERMFSSYVGGDTGMIIDALQQQGNESRLLASINNSTYVTPTGLPCVQLGFQELQFSLAEAANLGWITGDAETYYEKGIRADMEFYGVSADDVNTFLTNPANVYRGDNADGLKQIREQKYVALFQNSGFLAFFEQRRTGVPVFSVGEGNLNNGRIPKRWMYPVRERQYNEENLKAALQAQFNGSDDINNVMWLIK